MALRFAFNNKNNKVNFTFPIEGAPGRVTNPNDKDNWKIRSVQKLLGVNPMPSDKQLVEFTRYLNKGDELADNLVLWMHEVGLSEGRDLFNQALEQGIDSIAEPNPALRAFFEQVDRVPLWVDHDKMRLACDVSRRVGPMAEMVLGSVALMGAYVSAAAVKPLAFTSQLDNATTRRLVETGKFWVDVTTRGGLEREAEGFKSAVRVRLMHAQVRYMLNKSPKWDKKEWGEPLNQADTVATNLLFSQIFIMSLRVMGFRFSKAEREAVIHLWRYIGFLMGIDEAILPADEDDAMRSMYLQYLTLGESDEDTHRLGQSLMNAPYERFENSKIPEALTHFEVKYRSGLSRLVLGDKAADSLGLPDDASKYLLFATSPLVFAFETLRLRLPGANALVVNAGRYLHEKAIPKGLEIFNADTTFTPVKKLAR